MTDKLKKTKPMAEALILVFCKGGYEAADGEYLMDYSYRKLSTGSSCEARVAGTVPKMMPTTDDTTMAMIADRPEMGRW